MSVLLLCRAPFRKTLKGVHFQHLQREEIKFPNCNRKGANITQEWGGVGGQMPPFTPLPNEALQATEKLTVSPEAFVEPLQFMRRYLLQVQ